MPVRVWAERLWLAAAAGATLAILGFYASRLTMPLPLFAGDEAAYLIRALWPDPVVANNPYVAALNSGAHLSVIRALYVLGAPLVIGDRLVNAAAYLGGVLLVWRTSTRRLPGVQQMTLLLLALGFSYYRFAFSDLPEGLFVGVLALLLVVTGRWYRTRPLIHALSAGALAAVLVLVKPHGIAVVAALAALAGLDALAGGDWRRLPIRALVFAVIFFALGNLIQVEADAPAAHPLSFFVGDFYAGALALKPPPDAAGLGILAVVSMTAAMAVLAAAPLVIAGADIFSRWRAARGRFEAEGPDLAFLLLALSLAATLAMVALFTMQVSGAPVERKLMWGRYFEFYAPLIWLAAAPAMARPVGPRVRAAGAGVMLAGLVGLVASLQIGIVLYPWDSSLLTAFFQSDPIRAPGHFPVPLRALAIAASLLAAGALALRVRPAHVGLALILTLGGLSTWLDHAWMGPLVAQNRVLDREFAGVRRSLPPTGDIVLVAPDANRGDLTFLRLDARPWVYLGPPGQTPPERLSGAAAVVVSGPEAPPGGPWRETFKGQQLSVWRPALRP